MRHDATIGRLLAAIAPYPDLGKPRLWSHGVADEAVRQMPWPLPLARELAEPDAQPGAAAPASPAVVDLAAHRVAGNT